MYFQHTKGKRNSNDQERRNEVSVSPAGPLQLYQTLRVLLELNRQLL
jgi:hypothetical protein